MQSQGYAGIRVVEIVVITVLEVSIKQIDRPRIIELGRFH